VSARRRLLPRVAGAVLAGAGLLGLLAPPASGAPAAGAPAVVVVRVFALKYRSADEALSVVRPLLSDLGSVMLDPHANELTVRDTAASVARAAQAIAAYDLPLRGVDVAVTLLKASADPKASPGKADVSEEIRGIGERLKKLLNVTDFTRLDSVVVRGLEGQRVAYVIGTHYHLQFVLDPSRDGKQLRFRDLSLERIRREGAKETRGEILHTTINVNMGQPYILGVGKDEAAQGALFLVFFPEWRKAGPGIFLN
jgi:hypothetical protein